MSRGKIALIEDDLILSKVVKESLEEEGFLVVTAHNGNDALSLVRDEKPILVLLDLLMPQKDGFEVLEILKHDEATSSIPVIVLTMISTDDSINKALDLGAVDYIVKSQHAIEEIVEKVKNVSATNMFRA